jgi:hypothetical protein
MYFPDGRKSPPAFVIVGRRRSVFFKRVTRFLAFLAGVGLASAQVAIPPTTISAGAVNTNDLGFLVRTVGIDWPEAGSSGWLNSVANMEQVLGPVTTRVPAVCPRRGRPLIRPPGSM